MTVHNKDHLWNEQKMEVHINIKTGNIIILHLVRQPIAACAQNKGDIKQDIHVVNSAKNKQFSPWSWPEQ